MKIEYVDINEIKAYHNNPRFNRKTINKLKELIANNEVVFNVPIVIDKKGVIIKGHARWTALKELGHKIVPVIYSTNSDEVNNEDRLQDNIIQELSTWKQDELSIEIRENDINPKDYNIELKDLGYNEKYQPDITGADITKARELFLGNKQKEKDFIELVCPYCGEEFMVDRDEVKNYV